MDWSLIGKESRVACYPTGATYYVTITTSTSANTKGNWVELVASTPFDGYVDLTYGRFETKADFLIDLAIGAVGSEIIIWSNLLFGSTTASGYAMGAHLPIPIFIPAGTRISARAQSTRVGVNYQYIGGVVCHEGGGFGIPTLLSTSYTYGANTADSGGVQLDPGGTVDTKGAWTEITASCAALKGILLAFSAIVSITRSGVNYWWHTDIGVGSAGNEQVLILDYPLTCHPTPCAVMPRYSTFIPVSIPSGTRISARTACNVNTANTRTHDIIIYGFA